MSMTLVRTQNLGWTWVLESDVVSFRDWAKWKMMEKWKE